MLSPEKQAVEGRVVPAGALESLGVPETGIASVLGIDAKTLRKHYRVELDTGVVKANIKVAESLFRKATGDGPQSVTAAIFWLKARAHWKEVSAHEHSGSLVSIVLTKEDMDL